MNPKRNTADYLLFIFIAYVVVVFGQSLAFKFADSTETRMIFGSLADWLVDRQLGAVAELFRHYGQYLVANLELVALVLLLMPQARIVGALLGLGIITVALLAHLFTPLGISIEINPSGQRDGGALFAMACGVWFSCFGILWLCSRKPAAISRRQTVPGQSRVADMAAPASQELTALDEKIATVTSDTLALDIEFNKLLFNERRIVRDDIVAEHKQVLARAKTIIKALPAKSNYFPKRPMILPKLLRAVNDDASKDDLVKIISQDPALAGELLKMANSPFYRISEEPVESLGRAIVVLGQDGLRTLASSLVLQPLVQMKANYFTEYPQLIWRAAEKSALAAQRYSQLSKSCDPFTAHLLGLLGSIGQIVVFQVVMDVYRDFSGVHPKSSVIKALSSAYADPVSASVAEQWGLSAEFIESLKGVKNRQYLNDMNALERSLYYGRLCACLHMLQQRAGELIEASSMANERGFNPRMFSAIWDTLEEEEAAA